MRKFLLLCPALLAGVVSLGGCASGPTSEWHVHYDPEVTPMNIGEVLPQSEQHAMLAAMMSRQNHNPIATKFFQAVWAYNDSVENREKADELHRMKKERPELLKQNPDLAKALAQAPTNQPPVTETELMYMKDSLVNCWIYFKAEIPAGVPPEYQAHQLIIAAPLEWNPEIPDASTATLSRAIASLDRYVEFKERLGDFCKAYRVETPDLPEVNAVADLCKMYSHLIKRDLDWANSTQSLGQGPLLAASEMGKAADQLLLLQVLQASANPDFLKQFGPKTAAKLCGTGPDDSKALDAFVSKFGLKDASPDQERATWRLVRLIDPSMFSGPDPAGV